MTETFNLKQISIMTLHRVDNFNRESKTNHINTDISNIYKNLSTANTAAILYVLHYEDLIHYKQQQT